MLGFNVINKPSIQYIIKARINTCDFKIILIITSSCQQSERWKLLIELNHLNGNWEVSYACHLTFHLISAIYTLDEIR